MKKILACLQSHYPIFPTTTEWCCLQRIFKLLNEICNEIIRTETEVNNVNDSLYIALIVLWIEEIDPEFCLKKEYHTANTELNVLIEQANKACADADKMRHQNPDHAITLMKTAMHACYHILRTQFAKADVEIQKAYQPYFEHKPEDIIDKLFSLACGIIATGAGIEIPFFKNELSGKLPPESITASITRLRQFSRTNELEKLLDQTSSSTKMQKSPVTQFAKTVLSNEILRQCQLYLFLLSCKVIFDMEAEGTHSCPIIPVLNSFLDYVNLALNLYGDLCQTFCEKKLIGLNGVPLLDTFVNYIFEKKEMDYKHFLLSCKYALCCRLAGLSSDKKQSGNYYFLAAQLTDVMTHESNLLLTKLSLYVSAAYCFERRHKKEYATVAEALQKILPTTKEGYEALLESQTPQPENFIIFKRKEMERVLNWHLRHVPPKLISPELRSFSTTLRAKKEAKTLTDDQRADERAGIQKLLTNRQATAKTNPQQSRPKAHPPAPPSHQKPVTEAFYPPPLINNRRNKKGSPKGSPSRLGPESKEIPTKSPPP